MCSPNMQHLNILHQQHCIDLWCVRMWHCHDGWRNLDRMMVEKLYERPSKVHCCKSLVSTSTAKCPPAPVVCLSADVYGGKWLGMWSLALKSSMILPSWSWHQGYGKCNIGDKSSIECHILFTHKIMSLCSMHLPTFSSYLFVWWMSSWNEFHALGEI